MANKKLTMKVVGKRLDFLLRESVRTQQAVDYVNKLIAFYIDFKDDIKEFQKYLEEKDNESRKSDSKESIKGNEEISVDEPKSTKGKSGAKKSSKSKG